MRHAINSFCVLLASVMLACSVQGQSHDMPRVVGGTLEAAPLPYQVSLFAASTHFCGGVLISRQTVLTAASCFTSTHSPSTVGVLAGTSTAVTGTGTARNVFSIDIHPTYLASTRVNDIAVVTLELPFDNSLTSIAPLAVGTAAQAVQTECTVSGWGGRTSNEQFSGELRTIFVNVVDPTQTCGPIYIDHAYTFLSGYQVCTMATNVGQGVCTTDLGGPLVCNNLVSGILSWGLSCDVTLPIVFTNIIPYNSWIESTRSQREGEAGSSAETVVFSSLLLSVLILLNNYTSS